MPSLLPSPSQFSDLERYAGWLGKDHVSIAVRSDVQALGAAMKAGSDVSVPLLALDKNIARLSSGDIRKMLRKAAGEVRASVAPGPVNGPAGDAL